MVSHSPSLPWKSDRETVSRQFCVGAVFDDSDGLVSTQLCLDAVFDDRVGLRFPSSGIFSSLVSQDSTKTECTKKRKTVCSLPN